MPAAAAVKILVGVVVLFLGRKLFWLFVAVAGFLAGLNFATRVITGLPDWEVLIIAVIAAVIGAVLAVLLQKVAIALAGFFVGGYLVMELLRVMNVAVGQYGWVAYLVGGVIGALLVLALFDWALIFLSSLSGAALIAQNAPVDRSLSAVIMIVLLIAGIMVQAALMRRTARPV
jgi:hypothetical protein